MMPSACGSHRYPSPPKRCGRHCGRNRRQGGRLGDSGGCFTHACIKHTPWMSLAGSTFRLVLSRSCTLSCSPYTQPRSKRVTQTCFGHADEERYEGRTGNGGECQKGDVVSRCDDNE